MSAFPVSGRRGRRAGRGRAGADRAWAAPAGGSRCARAARRWPSVVIPPLLVFLVVLGAWILRQPGHPRRGQALPAAARRGRSSTSAFLDAPQPRRAVHGPVADDEGRDGRAGALDRHRHGHGDRDVAGQVGRALAVPLRGRAADDPGAGDRPADRLHAGLRLLQPRARGGADRALPGHHQHPVRPALGRPGPPRPVQPAPAAGGSRGWSSCSCRPRCPRSSPACGSPRARR